MKNKYKPCENNYSKTGDLRMRMKMSSVCEDLEAVQQQMLANVIARMRKEAKAKKEKMIAIQ